MFSPNRREFLTGAAALGAYAALGRGVDGTRVGMRKSGHPLCEVADLGKSAKDYVQNGLICMWDAIENAGWKTHSSSPSVWKDLIGTRDATPNASVSFLDSKAVFSPGGAAFFDSPLGGPENTQEYVVACPDMINENREIGIGRFNSNIWSLANKPYLHSYVGLINAYIKRVLNPYAQQKIMHSYSHSKDYANLDGNVNAGTTYNDYRGGNGNYIGGETNVRTLEFCCIRIYDRELSQDEVAHNYAIDRARFNLP